MKYLNTSHLELLGSYGSGITSANGYIQTGTSTTADINRFGISVPSLTTLYFSFNCPNFNESIPRAVVAVSFKNVSNVVCIALSSSTIAITKLATLASSSSATTLWTGSATVDSDGNRLFYTKVDTTAKTIDLYCNGVLLVENLSYSLSSAGVAQALTFGKVGSSNNVKVYINNIIFSDAPYSPVEKVIEITPTITTTDWTVTSGVATTDTVGDEMVLTVPSGAIDETSVKPTGYTVGLLNSAPSANVNAVDITQGATTDQVILPSGATQSDYFTVSQASDISATVVARSVTV